MRAIFERLNSTVEWDAETQTITAYNDDITIEMTARKNEMYKNGKMIWLDNMVNVCIVIKKSLCNSQRLFKYVTTGKRI